MRIVLLDFSKNINKIELYQHINRLKRINYGNKYNSKK